VQLLTSFATLALDFYGAVKLINYLRQCQRDGVEADFESNFSKDDKYLQPVMEKDAVLINLDEITDSNLEEGQDELTTLNAQYIRLREEFNEYKAMVQSALDARWATEDSRLPKDTPKNDEADPDDNYFVSYSYNGMI